jgi:hypothetical protein
VGSQKCDLSALRVSARPVLCDGQVSPCGRDQRAGSVGQHQRQMKLTAPVAPTKYLERRSREGMARANNGYLIGVAVEMTGAVVGSLSGGLSTTSRTNSCSRRSGSM